MVSVASSSSSSSSSSRGPTGSRKRVALGDITAATLRAEAEAAAAAAASTTKGRRKRALPHTSASSNNHPAPRKPASQQQQQQQPPAFFVEMELEGQADPACNSSPSSPGSPGLPLKKPRSDNDLRSTSSQEQGCGRPLARCSRTGSSGDLICEEAAAASTPLGLATITTSAVAAAAAPPNTAITTAPATDSSSNTSKQQPAQQEQAQQDAAAATAGPLPLPPGVIDIDAADPAQGGLVLLPAAGEPRLGPAYSGEYHRYLREREACARDAPRADYLSGVQRGAGLTQDMRALLVDWLVTVAGECELMPSTLQHAVALVDRALSAFPCPKERLQCLGSACLLIAGKFEETAPPTPREIRYAAADSFSAQDLVAMEMRVAEALGFRVAAVTPYHFLPRFLRAAGARGREAALVHYLSELALLHYEFLAFPPSLRAAAALLLARATLAAQQPDPRRRALALAQVWTPTLAHYTGYSADALAPCAALLRRAHEAAEWSAYEALRAKYALPAWLHVAEGVPCLEPAQLEEALAALAAEAEAGKKAEAQ